VFVTHVLGSVTDESPGRAFSFGGRDMLSHASLQMSDASLVLLPESFRGGCSIGAGFTGLSQIACANDAAYIAVARREQLAKSELTHYAGQAQFCPSGVYS
jgi:hypothetical protein